MKLFALSMLLVSPVLHAEDALIAVATNFAVVAESLKSGYELSSGHRITIATGSTGKLYAQILHGAPFDALLAADQERPELLDESGHAIAGSRFTYASGRLALWSKDSTLLLSDIRSTLTQSGIHALAIANPAVAPYGVASRQVLQSLNLWKDLKHIIVMGENAGQTHALVETSNADLGIGAFSLVAGDGNLRGSAYLQIPENLHAPIRQDAVLLRHGAGNQAATGFLEFLKTEGAQSTIASLGYSTN
jgi:molybdate transport system substrate-binding protein